MSRDGRKLLKLIAMTLVIVLAASISYAKKSSIKTAKVDSDKWTNGDDALAAALKLLRKKKFFDKEEKCYFYQIDTEAKQYYSIQVLENHKHEICGGDPDSTPSLFVIRIYKKDGRITTNAHSELGQFKEVAP